MDRNYYYFIDKEGRVLHERTEINDVRFLSLVYRTMQQTEHGLLVRCQGENCWLRFEDAPYVIQDVILNPNEVTLLFPGGYSETLDPTTLAISAENVLYCSVRKGAFEARFSRKAYLHIVSLLMEDRENEFSLCIGGKRCSIMRRRTHSGT